jgi:hypothetical protein
MAINLSKNNKKQLVYSTREKKRMNVLLFMTIFMVLATTAAMMLGFAVLPVSRNSYILITCVIILGYLTAFAYYDSYQKLKSGNHE